MKNQESKIVAKGEVADNVGVQTPKEKTPKAKKTEKAIKQKVAKVVGKAKTPKAKKGKEVGKAKAPIRRTILGVQLSKNVATETNLTLDVLQKAKTPLSFGRIVESVKAIKIEQGTNPDSKFSNLETRIRRSLRNTVTIANSRDSVQSKKFSIESNYSNVRVKEEDGKFSITINGKAPNVRQTLEAPKPKKSKSA